LAEPLLIASPHAVRGATGPGPMPCREAPAAPFPVSWRRLRRHDRHDRVVLDLIHRQPVGPDFADDTIDRRQQSPHPDDMAVLEQGLAPGLTGHRDLDRLDFFLHAVELEFHALTSTLRAKSRAAVSFAISSCVPPTSGCRLL